ncbi:MAG: helicase-related protein [Gammaproteobacteria bacterium]|nr:helicase-related protein [Gammaproteobacteria bacterium]
MVDTRFDALIDLIDELLRSNSEFRPDERLIVFTEYKTTLDYLARRLREHFPPERILTLFGAGGTDGLDQRDRENVKAEFNDPASAVRILVATDAASEGLNLHRTARYLLHYDCPWNPSRLEQRNGRLDRYGQGRDVTVHHFVSEAVADLVFLDHVIRKADEIREDLGSLNEIFDRAVHRRLIRGEDSVAVQAELDLNIDKARGKSAIEADNAVKPSQGGTREAARLEAMADEIDLDPHALLETLDTALSTGRQRPQLEAAEERGLYRVKSPDLHGWRDVIDDAVRTPSTHGGPGSMPKLAFSTDPFMERLGRLTVFLPRHDALLMHLAHPLVQRGLSTLARRRYPGEAQVSRWTVRLGDVPANADAVILLSIEELAVNDLRETFHRWVRTVTFPVRDGDLDKPLPHAPAIGQRNGNGATMPEHRDVAAEALLDTGRSLQDWIRTHAEELTASLKDQLVADHNTARQREDERYRQRQGELSTLIEQSTVDRLEREIAELQDKQRQGQLFDEAEELSHVDQSIEAKRDEIARRKHLYEEIREQLRRERTRILDHLLPKRYALAGSARVPGRDRGAATSARLMNDRTETLAGWDRLSHHGLLLDVSRLQDLARLEPEPLSDYTAQQLRLRAGTMMDEAHRGSDASANRTAFVTFVLEQVCGLDAATGTWLRGTAVPSSERRRTATGESVKPNHLWKGIRSARMPVFIDDSKRLGLGRSRRLVSQAIGYLRAGNEHLALLTNGRHWRLLFAGLDYEAWCDWDTDLWFEEGELADQVSALRILLNAKAWTPDADGATPALLQAIRDTRKGQAELSEVLGERVREAVEILIRGHGDILTNLAITHSDSAAAADIYRAGCRVAMRLVVILFAESRELLPRDNALYHDSYGLNGLFEQLERDAAQGRAMRESYSAWPRVLALFKLVREGSHHPDLPVTRYGGELFAPGESEGDALSESLAVFENASLDTNVLPDADVHEILRLLTRTTMRIRQRRSSTRTIIPVDFTDLSSEYIGILYEGLLDYELKTAPADDPVVFLAAGDQPALPLSRLEAMDTKALKALFSSFKDSASDSADETEEEEDAAEPADTQPSPELPIEEAAEAHAEFTVKDDRQLSRERAERWAREAVQAAGLVSRRGKSTPERQLRLREEIGRKARQLVARVVLPGEWYLVRWGGTRKGSGSFYTRPGLTIPTVQRTLRPLAYEPPKRANGKPNPDAPATEWTPRTPERILELKVCDPACGSGSFPLAALRFLTDAVYAALQHHGRIEEAAADRSLVRLLGVADGPHEGLAEEQIPCPPDDDRFEDLTKAVLRRYVVERCIYAVDVDPLAVELCRLSLWIETMDRSLPFGFLDHKIKCGNSLIGAWFDEFAHYPAMAWKNREGGDKGHSNGVHFEKNARGNAIKAFANEKLKLELKLVLQEDMFGADLLALASATHARARAVIDDMHALPVQDADKRASLYRDELLASEAWSSLKEAMDLWAACWFWPIDEVDVAPTPATFSSPSGATRAVAQRVAAEERFFHWELEFPDVFRQVAGVGPAGFDAVLGNPPWDIAKPVSKEFFSNHDPLYRSYGKQEALRRQKGYFDEETIERDWVDYNARFRAQSNYMSYAGNPFGDPGKAKKSQARFSIAQGRANATFHEDWRNARGKGTGFADPTHPYRHQGSADLNLYKLFLEKAHALLSPHGRLGFLVPSGLYSDHGTQALRSLFLEHCQWEWLFGVENRDGIFPIHRSYKFNPIIVQKGGETDAINTAFMRRKLEDWERAEDVATPYSRGQVEQFSPNSRAILEIQSARDLEILEKIYANGVLLGDDGPEGWGIKYATEFHMTNDSHLFPPRPEWEAKGYRPDEYSRWLLGDWRPIEELWEMLGVDPSKPEPAEIELEDWLFDTTAGPERREAEAQFVHGHWLKPGDVARTDWRLRCAQPPYDRLPVPRVRIPAGIVLSREGDAWIREEAIKDTALPLMQGAMLHQFDFSQKGWVSGTGLQARWSPINMDTQGR